MSIKNTILLIVSAIVILLAITTQADASDNLSNYEQQLNTKKKSYNSIIAEIRSIRVAIKEDKGYIKNIDKDIQTFEAIQLEITSKYVVESIHSTSFENYKQTLIAHKQKALKEIQSYNKKLKKKSVRKKKLWKSIKAIKKKIDNIKKRSFNGVLLQYNNPYYICSNRLTKSKGVVRYNGHRETYYSQRVLPGQGLNIPGRHVADDGTIRDAEGYICVAANPSFYPRHSILMISLGPAKVYDCGCAYGTIDVYCNW